MWIKKPEKIPNFLIHISSTLSQQLLQRLLHRKNRSKTAENIAYFEFYTFSTPPTTTTTNNSSLSLSIIETREREERTAR